MSKKDYILIANVIKRLPDDLKHTASITVLIYNLANALESANNKFIYSRFLKACGIEWFINRFLLIKYGGNKMYKILIQQSDTDKQAYIYKGKPLAECPKTYKKISVISHNIGNLYNSTYLTLFKARDNSLRYEIYRDGNFFPYYGRFEWIDNSLL